MNQVTNLIQWKNLTQEQQDDFDFENYRYEYQIFREWIEYEMGSIDPKLDMVYRLVIEEDKYYVYDDEVFKGDEPYLADSELLRPARPDEIPQDEITLERKIEDKWPDKEVVMLKEVARYLRIDDTNPHVIAQSMKGFTGYVYQRPQDDSFFSDIRAIYCYKYLTLQPVAVLFEAQK